MSVRRSETPGSIFKKERLFGLNRISNHPSYYLLTIIGIVILTAVILTAIVVSVVVVVRLQAVTGAGAPGNTAAPDAVPLIGQKVGGTAYQKCACGWLL